jgi:hypothetical protein
MIQEILAGFVVLVALCVSAWKLMPAQRRLKTLLALDGWTAKRPALAAWRERSLKPRITRAAGAGCAGCAANVGIKPHHPPR